ncbi:hypothetical protein OKW24_003002 [Peribacillus simplex]|nr:hypothetical protein [Peribacillus simplex]
MRARTELKDSLPEIRNSVRTAMQKELRIEYRFKKTR